MVYIRSTYLLSSFSFPFHSPSGLLPCFDYSFYEQKVHLIAFCKSIQDCKDDVIDYSILSSSPKEDKELLWISPLRLGSSDEKHKLPDLRAVLSSCGEDGHGSIANLSRAIAAEA